MFKYLIAFVLFSYSYVFSDGGISYRTFEDNKATVHVIEIDPKKYDFISARPQGVIWEDVQFIDKAFPNAVAAINAGFYVPDGEYVGLPLGILKINNNWYCTSQNVRGTIGWSNITGKVLMDEVCTKTTINVQGVNYPIDGVNLLRTPSQATIYNEFFLNSTKTTAGMEYIIDNGTVAQFKGYNATIPKQGFVLSIGPDKPLWLNLNIGSPVSYHVEVIPKSLNPSTVSKDWDQVEYTVGGLGVLIRDGKLHDFSIDNIADTIRKKKHPRTAVGILGNGHWVLVVVDGRRNVPGRPLHKSVGISLPNLALLMLKLGCLQALNLDGGGSTTMILHHEVINEPCGYDLMDRSIKLRKVSDAIIILPKNEIREGIDNAIRNDSPTRKAA